MSSRRAGRLIASWSIRAVTKADIPRLVEIAVADICHQTNPRKCAAPDFAALFDTAL